MSTKKKPNKGYIHNTKRRKSTKTIQPYYRNENKRELNQDFFRNFNNILVIGDEDASFSTTILKIRPRYEPNIVITLSNDENTAKLKYGKEITKSLNILKRYHIYPYYNFNFIHINEYFPKRLKAHYLNRKTSIDNDIKSTTIDDNKLQYSCQSQWKRYLCYPFHLIIYNITNILQLQDIQKFFESCRPHLYPPNSNTNGKAIIDTGGKILLIVSLSTVFDEYDIEKQAVKECYRLKNKYVFNSTNFSTFNCIKNIKNPIYSYLYEPTKVGWKVAHQEATTLCCAKSEM